MAYTSLDRLLLRFGKPLLVQLTDRGEVPTGAVDVARVEQAIADAGAAIDASLGVRYRLPLAAVPAAVADLALAIAIYKLHVDRPGEKIEKDHELALADLRYLADGRKTLDLDGVEPAGSGASGVVTSDRTPMFTAASLRGFI